MSITLEARVEKLEKTVAPLRTEVTALQNWAGPGQNQVFSDNFIELRKQLDKFGRVQERHEKKLDHLAKVQDEHTRKLDTLTADVATLKTDVAELKTDVAELKTDVAGLKSDMGEVKGTLREILDRLPAKPGK